MLRFIEYWNSRHVAVSHGIYPMKYAHHYECVIMDAMASQITSLTIVYSTVYSGADQNKYQSSASRAFVWGIHRGPVISPHKWPVTRKLITWSCNFVLFCMSSVFIFWWNQAIYLPIFLRVAALSWGNRGCTIGTSYKPRLNVNTLRPRQDGLHFPDDIFNWFFLEWICLNFD